MAKRQAKESLINIVLDALWPPINKGIRIPPLHNILIKIQTIRKNL